jgi:RES domain-containing protein
MLFRIFPPLPAAGRADAGGPLYVPRTHQGRGRHDNPDAYGALYLSRTAVASVAELLLPLRTQPLVSRHLTAEGFPYALATIDDDELGDLLDLDDPRNLLARSWRPSGVATRDREVTQPIALAVYQEGVEGFEWWSTVEASWINVTLFQDRVTDHLSLAGEPEPLTLDHPVVREAAEAIGVSLA